MKIWFVFAFCAISLTHLSAQTGTFSRVYYDSFYNVHSFDIMRGDSNKLYIAGSGMITCTDTVGNLLETHFYSNQYQSAFNCIIADPQGNPVVAGRSDDGDAFIMKTKPDGDTLWSKIIDFGVSSEAFTISQVHDSGFVVCGYVYNASGNNPMFVARIDKNGAMQWSATYTTATNGSYAYSVKETSDTAFLVCGYASELSPAANRAVLMKLNLDGSVRWCHAYTYGSGTFNSALDVLNLGNGYLIGGVLNSSYSLFKTDTSGQILWATSQDIGSGGYLNSPPSRLRSLSNGRVMINIASDLWGWSGELIVCDTFGIQHEHNSIMMQGTSAVELSDGGFMVLGNGPLMAVKQHEKNIIYNHFVLVKTDSAGNTATCAFNGTISNTFYGPQTDTIAVSAVYSGSIHAIPVNITSATLSTADECVGVTGGFPEIQTPSVNVFPNPSNGAFNLEFTNFGTGEVALIEIWTTLGKTVFSTHEKTSSELCIETSALDPGMYMLTITAGSVQISKPLMIE